MKLTNIVALAILALGLTACGLDLGDETKTYTDSLNGSYNTNTDSYNTYTDEQKGILEDGYIPEEEGVCGSGYFWCSIEERCLPSGDGATCPLAHTDEAEAEAEEINDNN